jgi:hypothetical protein
MPPAVAAGRQIMPTAAADVHEGGGMHPSSPLSRSFACNGGALLFFVVFAPFVILGGGAVTEQTHLIACAMD